MTVDDRTPELAEFAGDYGWTDDDMDAWIQYNHERRLEDAAEAEHREAQLAEEPLDYADFAGLDDDAPTPPLRWAA